jgi:predicted HTH domain antitoxin
MYFDLMAESTHFYKKTEKGVSNMCKLMEDMRNDEKVIIAIKLLKRGKESLEEIAEDSGLSLEDVKDLAAQLDIIPE